METFEEVTLPLGESLPRTCADSGQECRMAPLAGGITLPFLVRGQADDRAPLLVLVHHCPAERCVRCGKALVDGPLTVAVERGLEARLQRGETLPAEMEFAAVQAVA